MSNKVPPHKYTTQKETKTTKSKEKGITTTTTETSYDEKLTLKEIRETLYHCRDFEITNLWQRSVFLFGFILACFTGYGTILMSLLTEGLVNITHPTLAHFIECIISLIGITFSVIWILMAKGSKAWYEVYERAIGEIERKHPNMTKYLDVYEEYRMGNYCKLHKRDLDDSILSNKGGRYSPSKLNVFIGQVLFMIWLFCFIGHIVAIIVKSFECDNILHWILVCLGVVLIVGFYLWLKWNVDFLHSSALGVIE